MSDTTTPASGARDQATASLAEELRRLLLEAGVKSRPTGSSVASKYVSVGSAKGEILIRVSDHYDKDRAGHKKWAKGGYVDLRTRRPDGAAWATQKVLELRKAARRKGAAK